MQPDMPTLLLLLPAAVAWVCSCRKSRCGYPCVLIARADFSVRSQAEEKRLESECELAQMLKPMLEESNLEKHKLQQENNLLIQRAMLAPGNAVQVPCPLDAFLQGPGLCVPPPSLVRLFLSYRPLFFFTCCSPGASPSTG